MAELVDIASKIDVEKFYREHVLQFKKTGKQATGRCPFHDDSSASFSMNLETGQCQCFAGCFSGNIVSFYGKVHNMDNDEAFKSICEEYDIKLEEATTPKKNLTYTVEKYAEEKHLDADFLRKIGMRDSKNGMFVSIPYADQNGEVVRSRLRYARKQFKWSNGSELCLYGLWRLKQIKEAGRVVLVEGESDSQTLMQLGIPVLGVPGATTMKEEWASLLDGLEVVVHDEGDKGAEAFQKKVYGALGRTFKKFRCKDADITCKDPNDLLKVHGPENARAFLLASLASAVEYEPVDELIPSSLVIPDEYLVEKLGITHISDKEASRITSTPMYFSSTIRCTETSTEKVELTMFVRGRKIVRIFERDVLLSTRSIVSALAPLGANVSSETAKSVVSYLAAFDAANHDLMPLVEATPRLGWSGSCFVPYDGDVTVDDGIDERKVEYLRGFEDKSGTLDEWASFMEPNRMNCVFRFVMAASFSSPLLEVLKSRVFIVYNWASSRSGKTAALKAAMSIWGDPERTVSTFNGTQNAIESIAGFFNNMPLAIDERQMRTGKYAQDELDQLVYTLSSGRGKDRGTRTGGLRSSEHWRNVVISTGEMPMSGAASMTGVLTRTLEIEGSPFGYDEEKARSMHEFVRSSYGTAGRAFVEYVKGQDVRALYERMRNDLLEEVKGLGSVSSHIEGATIAAVADYMASVCVFGYEDSIAWSHAVVMSTMVLQSIDKEADIDNSLRALDVVLDWIASNADKFVPESQSAFPMQGRLGEKKSGGYAIIGTCLREQLEKHGFNVKSVVKQLSEKGYFSVDKDGQYTKKMTVGQNRVRCYFLTDRDRPKDTRDVLSQTYFETIEA